MCSLYTLDQYHEESMSRTNPAEKLTILTTAYPMECPTTSIRTLTLIKKTVLHESRYWTSHLYEGPFEFVHEAVYTLISIPQRP
jgi:hypothetical protein